MIIFKTTTSAHHCLVEIELEGVVTPEALKSMAPPEVDPRKGVVLSGRAPIWLYGALIHEYHPTAWVATFDPRLGGAVVVMSHTPEIRVGDVLGLWRQPSL